MAHKVFPITQLDAIDAASSKASWEKPTVTSLTAENTEGSKSVPAPLESSVGGISYGS
ncbi:hypothetical protein AB8S08_02640 [Pseudidiomarina sp. PP-1MA]|uniref:Uncharacterized protein n=1 Tax=Pseudidiomarina sp. PP-1MA TaxID=3237706 RepID=A0AB39X8J3_9GAMM